MCVCIKVALLAAGFRLLQTPGRVLADRCSISTVHLYSGTGGTQFKSRLHYQLLRLKIFVVFFSPNPFSSVKIKTKFAVIRHVASFYVAR